MPPLSAAAPPALPATRRAALPLRPLVAVAVGLLLALLAVAGLKTWRDLETVRAREVQLRQRIAATEREIATLEARIERLRNDPAALERAAREELHMRYPGEVEVVLPAEAEGAPARSVVP